MLRLPPPPGGWCTLTDDLSEPSPPRLCSLLIPLLTPNVVTSESCWYELCGIGGAYAADALVLNGLVFSICSDCGGIYDGSGCW